MIADNGDIQILVNRKVGAQMQSYSVYVKLDQRTYKHVTYMQNGNTEAFCSVKSPNSFLFFFPPLIDNNEKALCNVRINKEYSCKHTVCDKNVLFCTGDVGWNKLEQTDQSVSQFLILIKKKSCWEYGMTTPICQVFASIKIDLHLLCFYHHPRDDRAVTHSRPY